MAATFTSANGNISIPQIGLIGNPIYLLITDIVSTAAISFTIKDAANTEVYKASALKDLSNAIKINISEVLASLVSSSPLVASADLLIHQASFLSQYSVVVTGIGTVDAYCCLGGISNAMYRRLAENNTNIFAFKFQNPAANYLLSTRSSSRTISMSFAELAPMLCFNPQKEITIFNAVSGEILATIAATTFAPASAYELIAINLPAIISAPGKYAIVTDKDLSVIIDISESSTSIEQYILRFRNSLGAYELIEVSGRASSSPKYGDENQFAQYDAITDTLVNSSLRRHSTDTIKVESGYRSQERLLFIRDLLQSDDIHLQEASGHWTKVFVSAEDTIPLRMLEPTSLGLTITKVESEKYHLPDLYADDDGDYTFYENILNPEIQEEEWILSEEGNITETEN